MPPPPLPYSASTSEFPPHQYQNSIPDSVPPKGSRSKNAGFRPIGQNSSSLRKFFPGDEDEEPIDPPTPRSRSAALHDDAPSVFLEPASTDGDAANMSLSTTPIQEPPRNEFFQEESVDPRPVKDPRRAKATNGHTRSDSTNAEAHEPSSRKRNDLYSILSQVGEGTFGKVYKARNTSTGLFVALKRVRMEAERDGFPVTAMREIKLLQSLQHPNVVCLHEMMVSNGKRTFHLFNSPVHYSLRNQAPFTWCLSTWIMI
jgi:CTD kinase subunit alpha